jgi:hypothetical protein
LCAAAPAGAGCGALRIVFISTLRKKLNESMCCRAQRTVSGWAGPGASALGRWARAHLFR